MSERRLVDTNLVVRYLVQDHEKHAKIAGRVFDACDRGEVVVVVLPSVLAECVFVLQSFYKHPRGNIASALSRLISSPGVEIDSATIHLDALDRYRKTKIHFVDCMVAATAATENVPVAPFDPDFRKFPDVRIEINGFCFETARQSSTLSETDVPRRTVRIGPLIGLKIRYPQGCEGSTPFSGTNSALFLVGASLLQK